MDIDMMQFKSGGSPNSGGYFNGRYDRPSAS